MHNVYCTVNSLQRTLYSEQFSRHEKMDTVVIHYYFDNNWEAKYYLSDINTEVHCIDVQL